MTETDTDPRAALDAIRDDPVFLAHNANVDALARVDADLEAALDPPRETWPGSIDSPAAFSTAIARTMERGKGDLLAMADGFDAWLADAVDPDEQRLGGQAAITADLVALLDGDLSVVPLAAAPTADRTKRNWIFEFSRGDRFFDATAAADTRFIAASRPDRFNLETGLEPVVDDLAESVECALVSGYQSLNYEYEDGTTFREHVENGAAFLRALADRGVIDDPADLETGLAYDFTAAGRAALETLADHLGVDYDGAGLTARIPPQCR